jgi:AraC family transcriptional activator of pobA
VNVSLDFLHHTVRERNSSVIYHTHSNYEVVYYVRGSGLTSLGKDQLAYEAGTFTVIQPGCSHNELRLAETEVIFLCFYFDNQPVCLKTGFYRDSDGRIGRILQAMKEELTDKRRWYDLALYGLLCQLIAELSGYMSEPGAGEVAEKVRYASAFMEQYCCGKIDLQGLAANLGYSYDHFRHFFKQRTGYSPTQFIIRNRVLQAKQLLTQTDKPISMIAEECGFSNAPQFSLIFKQDTGRSPNAYRKKRNGDVP